MPRGCYLDHAATAPLDPRVAEEMRPFVSGGWCGNPSSLHAPGRHARAAVDDARQHVATLLHASPDEIVFTASGTEASNLALVGAMTPAPGGHLVTSAFEHPAVLATARHLEERGWAVTYLPVGADGLVDPDALRRALRPETRLVSVMVANNVVGTIQPWVELGRIAREHGALFHTDAVQGVGKLPLDVGAQPIDLLSLSAHKLGGPQGVGALFVRRGLRLGPVTHGGGQEGGLRAGTENVPAIVGLGRAAELARAEMAVEAARLVGLRDRIIDEVLARLPGAYLIGDRFRRLPGHVCLGFSGLEGDAIRLLLALDQAGIAVSSGSACSSRHAGEPSHVLAAMGHDQLRARGALRISLGRGNDDHDVGYLLDVLPRAVAELRPLTAGTSPGGEK